MELFEKDGLWGVKNGDIEFVPPNYEDPKEAIKEWKWFEIDNLNSDNHNKYLPWKKSLDEINRIEVKLLNANNSYELDVKKRFSDEEIKKMAFNKYPRLIYDPYNPQDDDNEEYRDVYIEGIKDILSVL
jgi:hypothetical protein